MGMPRRYHSYPEEFQPLNILSSAGASILGVGYLLPVCYLLWSLKWGRISGINPWGATGLEWEIPSPPPTENFIEVPHVAWEPYDFSRRPFLPDVQLADARKDGGYHVIAPPR
jgi:cytochrome c oxidase subunit 1